MSHVVRCDQCFPEIARRGVAIVYVENKRVIYAQIFL